MKDVETIVEICTRMQKNLDIIEKSLNEITKERNELEFKYHFTYNFLGMIWKGLDDPETTLSFLDESAMNYLKDISNEI